MTATFRKWRAVFGIYVQDGLAYRASGVIWILTDLVTAVTMPLVWAAAASGGPIAGLTRGDFVAYYLGMLVLGSFITSHMMWEMAMEIREGVFSVYLVRPISFYQFMFLRNLSWRCIRCGLTLPFFVALGFLYRGHLAGFQPNLGWELFAAVVLGHLVSFSFIMMMGMVALFVQEAVTIFELYYVPQLFLSGYLFPVALLPGWASALAKVFPFYYTTGAPTEILIGRISGQAAVQVLLTQAIWIVFCFLAARVLWRKGLKHYTGVGM